MTYTQAKEVITDLGRERLQELLNNYGEEMIEAGFWLGISPKTLIDRYSGKWNSDEEYAQELVESCGDIPHNFPCYIRIDWESTAQGLMMDCSEHNGHYFRQ